MQLQSRWKLVSCRWIIKHSCHCLIRRNPMHLEELWSRLSVSSPVLEDIFSADALVTLKECGSLWHNKAKRFWVSSHVVTHRHTWSLICFLKTETEDMRICTIQIQTHIIWIGIVSWCSALCVNVPVIIAYIQSSIEYLETKPFDWFDCSCLLIICPFKHLPLAESVLHSINLTSPKNVN